MTLQERLRTGPERSRTTMEAADKIDDLQAKLDQYRTEYFQTLRERDEYRKCADDAAMAHKVERDALMEQVAALAKDAGRYRWIRTCKHDSLVLNGDTQFCELMMEEVLDNAIDAAMKEQV